MIVLPQHTSVKHLNPRQGITTPSLILGLLKSIRVKHLNPRQGITTLIHLLLKCGRACERVKHLNPRQGITTEGEDGRWFVQQINV